MQVLVIKVKAFAWATIIKQGQKWGEKDYISSHTNFTTHPLIPQNLFPRCTCLFMESLTHNSLESKESPLVYTSTNSNKQVFVIIQESFNLQDYHFETLSHQSYQSCVCTAE